MDNSRDFEVCVCFHVKLRQLIKHYRLENPRVATQMAECYGAGTGCGWCVPFLESIFNQLENGEEPSIEIAAEDYRKQRKQYHKDNDLVAPSEEEVKAKLDEYLKEIPNELKLE